MITTSQAWKEYSRDVGIFHIKAVIDNGTQMTLTDEDFMQGSVNITDSISGMSDFTVGAVITNSFNATLNNFSGKFNNYNLAGARISVQFGIIFDGETEEWIDRGIYTLEKPTSLGSTIKVVGYDDMDKLNRYYIGKDADNNDITFPIYANALATKLCGYCGVTFGSWGLAGGQIDEFEYDESTTCRQVLSWIMQAWGGYARINPQGTLDCKQFNANAWTLGVEMDGGSINPWYGAGTVNGGAMNPWSAITDYDGGESGNIDFALSKIKSLNVYVEDIEVTGVRAYAYNTVDEFQFDTVGTGGYVLGIQDNPLVTDNTLAVATRVYNAVNGLKFRPFDASIIGDPSIEAGDIIALQDYLGNNHVSLITSLTYSVNSAERLECNAKTPEEADLETANLQTSVIKGATMAAYDYITAKKISASYISAGNLGVNGKITASDIEITGGEVGGFSIVNGKITTPYTVPHTYTQSDADRVRSIIAGGITPTSQDYELYDITQDGTIDDIDFLIVQTAVDDYDGVLSSVITIDPTSYAKGVSVESNQGSGSYVGASSMRSDNASFCTLKIGNTPVNDHIVNVINYNPTTSPYNNFKANGIELAGGLVMVGGWFDCGNLAMTSQYGSAYYATVNVTFPIYLVDTIYSINVSAYSSQGLVSASVNSQSSTGFTCFVWDTVSETQHVWLEFFITGK